MTVQDVAKELKLDWHTVKELDKQYMEKQLERTGSAGTRSDRDRRDIVKERAYVSDSGKRFGEEATDMVWRQGQVGR